MEENYMKKGIIGAVLVVMCVGTVFVVNKVKPTHIILIDSLCASSDERLGKSIQLTNTGICPGSGIGNRRKCIDKSLAHNVFSICVPLLIYASTFISSACEKKSIDLASIDGVMQKLTKQLNVAKELDVLNSVKNILNNKFDNCIVSIKDIEECVEKLSNIISTAINRLLGVENIYL
jgi:spore protease